MFFSVSSGKGNSAYMVTDGQTYVNRCLEPSFRGWFQDKWANLNGELPRKLSHLAGDLQGWAKEVFGDVFKSKARILS